MLTNNRSRHHGEAGFTLVELLVVMLIMGVIGAFTMSSLVQGIQTSDEADRRVQALTDLQQAGQRVSRELRMACHVEAVAADFAVVDILRDDTRYRYSFAVDGETLEADIDIVASDGTTSDHRTDRIAEGIVNGSTLFTYPDEVGTPMPAPVVPSAVRDVTLTLVRSTNSDDVAWSANLHLRNGGLSCGF